MKRVFNAEQRLPFPNGKSDADFKFALYSIFRDIRSEFDIFNTTINNLPATGNDVVVRPGAFWIVPAGDAAVTVYGVATTQQFAASQTRSTSSFLQKQPYINYQNGVLGNIVGIITTGGGTAAARPFSRQYGAFTCDIYFGLGAFPTSAQAHFIGLANSETLTGLTGPSATTDTFCIGADANDANWQFVTRTGTGTAVKVDTGVARAANVLHKVAISGNADASSMSIALYTITSFNDYTLNYSSTVTADLPTSTNYLNINIWGRATGTGDNHIRLVGVAGTKTASLPI